MPEILVERRLKVFLEDDLDRLFPSSNTVRVIAHPFRDLPDSPAVNTRIRHLKPPPAAGWSAENNKANNDKPRIVLAVGPESGW